MRYLKPVAGVVVGLAALLLAACSSAAGPSATSSSSVPNVAWITYSYLDYQQAEEEGLKSVLDEVGGTLTVFNAQLDPQKQLKQCVEAVSSGRYNVVVLAPVTSPSGVPCVQAAKTAGIPVITLEITVGDKPGIDPQVDGVVGSVVGSSEDAAAGMAKLVTEACAGKDPCKVVADTVPGDPYGEAHLTSIAAVPGVTIVAKINSLYDPAEMAQIAPDVLTAHPDTDVFVTLADGQALAAVPGIAAAGLTGKVKLLAEGGSRQGAKAVADGDIFGTLGAWPVQAGKAAGLMAVKAVAGETISPTGINTGTIDTPEIVTPDTVAQFTPEWGAAVG